MLFTSNYTILTYNLNLVILSSCPLFHLNQNGIRREMLPCILCLSAVSFPLTRVCLTSHLSLLSRCFDAIPLRVSYGNAVEVNVQNQLPRRRQKVNYVSRTANFECALFHYANQVVISF